MQSPYGKALDEAKRLVIEKLEELLATGQVVYGGYPAGRLDGDPQVIPLAILGARRPAKARFSVRGVTFHDVRLYPAGALSGGQPQPDQETGAGIGLSLNEQVCFDDLVTIFQTNPGMAKARPRELLKCLTALRSAYGEAREADTIKGWMRRQRDGAAETAARTG